MQDERIAAYGPLIAAMRERGFSADRYFSATTGGNQLNTAQLFTDAAALRARDPKALPGFPASEVEFERQWRERLQQRQGRDADTVRRSSTVPWLVGSFGAGLTDPVNIGSMILSGGGSAGLTLGRKVLIEGLVNAGTELVETPLINAERRQQGRPEMTPGEAATNIAVAGAIGAAIPAAGAAIGKARGGLERAVADHWDKLPEGLRQRWAARATIGNEAEADKLLADVAEAAIGTDRMSSDERAAVAQLRTRAENDLANPFVANGAGVTEHRSRLDEALARVGATLQREAASPAARLRTTTASPAVAMRQSGTMAYIEAVGRQESGGNPNARSASSSASGKYGFTDGTFVSAFRREFPESTASNAQILARKGELALQDRLMQRLTQENAAWLRGQGLPDDPGNLYVVHHLGQGDARKVFAADPATPLDRLLSAKVIAANPHMRGMTAGKFIAWAGEKAGGGEGGRVVTAAGDAMAGLDAEAAQLAGQRQALAEQRGALAGEAAAQPDLPPLPELRREDFPDEPSWRVAQAESDARALGIEPVATRQTIWADARDRLMADKAGEAPGALWHPAIGPIDVRWGDDKAGLAKIVAKHEEVLADLPALIADMEVVKETPNRIQLESHDHAAAVRLDLDGESKRWLLTAFERDPAKVAKALKRGEVPSPAVYRRAGDGAGASPTAGTMGEIALQRLGINPGGASSLDMQWGWALERGDKPRPLYGIVDGNGDLKHWETSQSRAERQMAKRGIEDGRVVRIDPPDRQLELFGDPRLGDDVTARFADAHGADAKLQADGLAHDVKAAIDAGEVQGLSFATRAEGAAESAEVALGRLDADDAALKALRGCM